MFDEKGEPCFLLQVKSNKKVSEEKKNPADRKISLQRIIGQSRAQVDRKKEQQVTSHISQQTALEASTPSSQSSPPSSTTEQSSTTVTKKETASPYSSSSQTYNTSTMSSSKNVLSSDVEIDGNLKFSNDLIVDGKIKGQVTSENGSLTIGENAHIEGEIITQRVTVFGKVEGNITVTERCEIKTNAEVIGDVQAATLTMEEGAMFSGQSRVGRASNAATTKPTSSSSTASSKPSATAAIR